MNSGKVKILRDGAKTEIIDYYSIAQRQEIINRYNAKEYVPFYVIIAPGEEKEKNVPTRSNKPKKECKNRRI